MKRQSAVTPNERSVGGRIQLAHHLFNHYSKLEAVKPTVATRAAKPRSAAPVEPPPFRPFTAEQLFQQQRISAAPQPLLNGMTGSQWRSIQDFLVAQEAPRKAKNRHITRSHYLNLRSMYRKINAISGRKSGLSAPRSGSAVAQPRPPSAIAPSARRSQPVREEPPWGDDASPRALPDEGELAAQLPQLSADSEQACGDFKESLLQLVFDFEVFTDSGLQRLFALAARRNAQWPERLIASLCAEARTFLYEQYEALRREEEEGEEEEEGDEE